MVCRGLLGVNLAHAPLVVVKGWPRQFIVMWLNSRCDVAEQPMARAKVKVCAERVLVRTMSA
jgi:hypothetical protein